MFGTWQPGNQPVDVASFIGDFSAGALYLPKPNNTFTVEKQWQFTTNSSNGGHTIKDTIPMNQKVLWLSNTVAQGRCPYILIGNSVLTSTANANFGLQGTVRFYYTDA